MSSTITVVVPGLFDRVVANDRSLNIAPGLEKLLTLAQSRSVPGQGYEASICSQFDCGQIDVDALPVAAITRFEEKNDSASYWWLRADPVHLMVDHSRLILAEADVLEIQIEESQLLIAALNTLYTDAGFWFDASSPSHWYIRFNESPRFTTTLLSKVEGRDVHDFLPSGENGRYWRGLLNEIQMLLYAASVNRVRETAGRVLINSVWFWGGGVMPNKIKGDWSTVFGRDSLTKGLAKLAHIPCQPLPKNLGADLAALGDNAQVLLVARPNCHITALDQSFFAPALQALQHGVLTSVRIITGDGREFYVSRKDLWRFWKRPAPLSTFMAKRPALSPSREQLL